MLKWCTPFLLSNVTCDPFAYVGATDSWVVRKKMDPCFMWLKGSGKQQQMVKRLISNMC